MSNYQIKHVCGCTVTHNICGTNVNGERERKAAWLSTQLCFKCFKKEQTKLAKEQNKDLPELTGSEKQIAWAETIRARQVKLLREALDQMNKSHELYATVEGLVNKVINNPSAKYWIDNDHIRFDIYFIKKLFDKHQANNATNK